MYTAIFKLESASPYSQSKHISPEKFPKGRTEKHDEYEKRTWRERMHVDENGEIFMPGASFKNCLQSAASFLGMKFKGQQTYAKRFNAGIMCFEPIPLGIKAETIQSEELFVPSDGKRGGAKRVTKFFPLIPQWSATVPVTVVDDAITKDILREHMETAGQFVGVGRFRPANGGYYGRFRVVDMKVGDAVA